MTFAVDSKGVATLAPNKEVLREWADELEFGGREQTNGSLNKDGGYCCLGVLCEIAVKHGIISPAVPVMGDYYEGDDEYESRPTGQMSYEDHTDFAPDEVNRWAFGDIEWNHNPALKWEDGTQHAADLNDALTATFPEIAQAIRKTFDL